MFPAGWSGANHDNIVNLFLHHLTYTSLLILSYYYDATFAYIDLTSGDFSLLAAIACCSILNCSCAAISPLVVGARGSPFVPIACPNILNCSCAAISPLVVGARGSPFVPIACPNILNCSCAATSPLDCGNRFSASLMIIFSFTLDKIFFRFLLLCMYIVYANQQLFRSEVRHN